MRRRVLRSMLFTPDMLAPAIRLWAAEAASMRPMRAPRVAKCISGRARLTGVPKWQQHRAAAAPSPRQALTLALLVLRPGTNGRHMPARELVRGSLI